MQLSSTRVSAGRASASGPSLEALALAAIRRNNGSLWGVPASNAGLFTDSAGTTPATAVGDVLGLVTDQAYGSGGLGPELVVNGDFSAGTAGWIAGGGSISNVGGELRIAGDNSFGFISARQSVPSVAGRTYRVSCRIRSVSGAPAIFYTRVGGYDVAAGQLSSGSTTSTSFVDFSGVVVATGSSIFLRPTINEGPSLGVIAIDNVSVREVLGNHATQPTTANKPVIAALPNGKRAMKFDGSNDLMNLGAGAVLSNAADHWACAAFIADTVGSGVRVLYGCSSTASATPLVCQLFIDPRPRVIWRTDDNVNSVPSPGLGADIVAGVPNVLTGARIGSTGYMWLNGQLAWSGSITGSVSTVNTANIGASVRNATVSYFAGKLATAAGQSTLAETDRVLIERFMAQQIGAQYLG